MMGKVWQLQEAKNKFSSLVDKARHEGPQIVTKHGKESVVVLSVSDYRKIIQPKTSLVDFFKKSPLAGISIKIQRDKSFSRDVEI
jgi:prevent-host-death family protein